MSPISQIATLTIFHLILTVNGDASLCNTLPSNSTIYTNVNGVQSSLKDAFDRDGYVTGLEIFEPNSAEMAHYVQQLNKLQSAVEHERFVGQEINPHLAYKFLWEIATQPRITSIIKEIFADEFALLATTLFTKYPQDTNTDSEYKYVGYHQDIRYWGLDPPHALNIFLAFDNITEDTGPMLYIPQTHKQGIYEHQVMHNPNNLLIGKQEIPQHLFDANTAIPVLLQSGSISIHHGSLIHGSGPNLSKQRRCGFVLRIMDLKTKITKKEDRRSQELEYKNHPQYSKHNTEWRTPRVICGNPTVNLHQFYPHPRCFIDNPVIPEPVASKSSRYFAPQRCEEEQCAQDVV